MTHFEQAALRLKQQLGVAEDRLVAAALGLKPGAWAKRKARGAFPERDLYALAAKRPELGLDVGYVLSGSPSQQPITAKASGTGDPMASLRVTYALGRQVPDMRQRGLRIETAYGEIDVPAGPLADQIAQLVEADLRRQLAAIEAEATA